jgi:glutathione S-transferase
MHTILAHSAPCGTQSLAVLEGILGENEHLLGSFSACDVPMASWLMYLATWHKDIDFVPYPNIIRYMKR